MRPENGSATNLNAMKKRWANPKFRAKMSRAGKKTMK